MAESGEEDVDRDYVHHIRLAAVLVFLNMSQVVVEDRDNSKPVVAGLEVAVGSDEEEGRQEVQEDDDTHSLVLE